MCTLFTVYTGPAATPVLLEALGASGLAVASIQDWPHMVFYLVMLKIFQNPCQLYSSLQATPK